MPLNDSRMMLRLNSEPLSKRMMTRVIVEKTLPVVPNASGVTTLKTGPMSTPIINNKSKSGTLRRLNSSVNTCAAKTRPPNITTVNAVESIAKFFCKNIKKLCFVVKKNIIFAALFYVWLKIK